VAPVRGSNRKEWVPILRRNLDGHHGENGRSAPTFYEDAAEDRNPDTDFVEIALKRKK
jgi:hypothetical protein